jgi:tripartite-type tricarboxylate transporter receptor subunit TctC
MSRFDVQGVGVIHHFPAFKQAKACAVLTAVLLGVLALSSAAVGADVYPSKPVRIIHGYQGGNSMDINSRVIAEKLSKMLGQQFVVEGKPGATGMIAAQVVKESKADGYTLFAAPDSNLISAPHLIKVPFDPFRDFTPISILCTFQYILVAHPGVPAKNARELIALAKQKPGQLTYASTGVGSGYHLATEKFCLMAGIKMQHVPYRGGGAAATPDLLKGNVALTMNNPILFLQYVRDQKLRALGMTGTQRLEILPDVPTISESGLPGYDMTGAQGMFAPAGTPKEIVLLLNDRIGKILQDPEIKKRWETGGQNIPPAHKPDYYSVELRRKYDMYEKLIKDAGVKLE